MVQLPFRWIRKRRAREDFNFWGVIVQFEKMLNTLRYFHFIDIALRNYDQSSVPMILEDMKGIKAFIWCRSSFKMTSIHGDRLDHRWT